MDGATSATPCIKIAYLILAHRYFDQLFRLVDRLNAGHVVFYIHIDKKVGQLEYAAVRKYFQAFKNVHFIKRFNCHWAGFGIMQATLQGIKEIVESEYDADYIALLSGQDYPIKRNDYIQSFLSEKKGLSFVSHLPFPHPEWGNERGGWDRTQLWHFITKSNHRTYPSRNFFGNGRLRHLNRIWNSIYPLLPSFCRRIPNDFYPYGGAQFWCLYKTHFHFIHQFVKAHPEYANFFRYVFVPDEILIQTIVGNSFPPNEIHNDTLHFLEWYRKGAILNSSDKLTILSTDYLFARKFDVTVDADILDIIDREILGLDEECFSESQKS